MRLLTSYLTFSVFIIGTSGCKTRRMEQGEQAANPSVSSLNTVQSLNLADVLEGSENGLLIQRSKAIDELEEGIRSCKNQYPVDIGNPEEKNYIAEIETLPGKLRDYLEKTYKNLPQVLADAENNKLNLVGNQNGESSNPFVASAEASSNKKDQVLPTTESVPKPDAELEALAKDLRDSTRAPFFKTLPKDAKIYYLVMGKGPTPIGKSSLTSTTVSTRSQATTVAEGVAVVGSQPSVGTASVSMGGPSSMSAGISSSFISGIVSGGGDAGHAAIVIGSLEVGSNGLVAPTKDSLYFSFPALSKSWATESAMYGRAYFMEGPEITTGNYNSLKTNGTHVSIYFVNYPALAEEKKFLLQYAQKKSWSIEKSDGRIDIGKLEKYITSGDLDKPTADAMRKIAGRVNQYQDLRSKKMPYYYIPNNCSDGAAEAIKALTNTEVRGKVLTIPDGVRKRLNGLNEWHELTLENGQLHRAPPGDSESFSLKLIRKGLKLASSENQDGPTIKDLAQCYAVIQVANFVKLSQIEASADLLDLLKIQN